MKITIYGEPKAKKRHRTYRRGNFVGAYNPSEADENNIRWQMIRHKPPQPLQGAIALGVKIFRSIPKSFSRKKHREALEQRVRPVTKPDLDNYLKLIKDSANGILWKDDSQVVEYLPGTGKYYGEVPRWEIEVLENVETNKHNN